MCAEEKKTIFYAIIKPETKKKMKRYMVDHDCNNLGEALDKMVKWEENVVKNINALINEKPLFEVVHSAVDYYKNMLKNLLKYHFLLMRGGDNDANRD